MGVWVGLGVWLRGGTVLACRLLESPNLFHSAEDATSIFHPNKTVSGHAGLQRCQI